MEMTNWKKFKSNHTKAAQVPYRGKERRKENDPTYFGYYALEGIERRKFQGRGYQGVERRKDPDPSYFGYYALEGIERRQAGGFFS